MDEIVKQFGRLPSTCVSDALDGLNNLHPSIKPLRDEWRVAGRAFPVKVRAADNLMVLKAIRDAEPGDVLVIDAKGYEYNAVCGDFVVSLARLLGIGGMVVDGAVRDVAGIRALDYPVFCRTYTVAASGKSGAGEVNVPISCGGVVVAPGDVIVGDADGVVVVPRAREAEVLRLALAKLEKDRRREEAALSSAEAAREYLDSVLAKKA